MTTLAELLAETKPSRAAADLVARMEPTPIGAAFAALLDALPERDCCPEFRDATGRAGEPSELPLPDLGCVRCVARHAFALGVFDECWRAANGREAVAPIDRAQRSAAGSGAKSLSAALVLAVQQARPSMRVLAEFIAAIEAVPRWGAIDVSRDDEGFELARDGKVETVTRVALAKAWQRQRKK